MKERINIMKRYGSLLITLLMLILLTSCVEKKQTIPEPSHKETVSITATPTQAPTSTVSPTETPAPTKEPTPTAEPTPTDIPAPTDIPTPTDIPASTEAPTPTPEPAIEPQPTPPEIITPEPVTAQPLIEPGGSYTSRDDVALYIHTYGILPGNFITKKDAQALGWSGGSLEPYAPGKCIGGDYFGNYEELLPDADYHECDIDTLGKKSRGAKRLVFDAAGNIYYTDDHYASFTKLY